MCMFACKTKTTRLELKSRTLFYDVHTIMSHLLSFNPARVCPKYDAPLKEHWRLCRIHFQNHFHLCRLEQEKVLHFFFYLHKTRFVDALSASRCVKLSLSSQSKSPFDLKFAWFSLLTSTISCGCG